MKGLERVNARNMQAKRLLYDSGTCLGRSQRSKFTLISLFCQWVMPSVHFLFMVTWTRPCIFHNLYGHRRVEHKRSCTKIFHCFICLFFDYCFCSTPRTLSMSIPADLAGAITLIDRFQVCI